MLYAVTLFMVWLQLLKFQAYLVIHYLHISCPLSKNNSWHIQAIYYVPGTLFEFCDFSELTLHPQNHAPNSSPEPLSYNLLYIQHFFFLEHSFHPLALPEVCLFPKGIVSFMTLSRRQFFSGVLHTSRRVVGELLDSFHPFMLPVFCKSLYF